jgi:hypothetical protein
MREKALAAVDSLQKAFAKSGQSHFIESLEVIREALSDYELVIQRADREAALAVRLHLALAAAIGDEEASRVVADDETGVGA